MAHSDAGHAGAADRVDPPDVDPDATAAGDRGAVVLGGSRGPAGIVGFRVGLYLGFRVRFSFRLGEQQRELAVPVGAAGERHDSQDPSALAALVARVTNAGKRPKISVTMPVVARPTRNRVPGELTTA